jgi:type I restriction enzyme M protein
MILTNPPFGKKSSFTVVGASGRNMTDKISYERPDFWATTSNKQLNFVQHVFSTLKDEGRAAVVVPDNVLFEGGAGEKIRRSLLIQCDVHTLLRLPTGIWYSPGVKANVLFFDKKVGQKAPATKDLWVYDLRANNRFTLRENQIADDHLSEFIEFYQASNRSRRKEAANFRRYSYGDIVARDKANMDIQWRQNVVAEPERSAHELMQDILGDLKSAMDEFSAAESALKREH